MQKTIFYGCSCEAVVRYICDQLLTLSAKKHPLSTTKRLSTATLLRKLGGIAFSDSSSELWDTTFYGLPVIPPIDISGTDYDRIVISACSAEEIFNYLTQKLDVCPSIIVDFPARQPYLNRLRFLRTFAFFSKKRGLCGDVAEGGVYKGDFAKEINVAFPKSPLFLFDTFEGFSDAVIQSDTTYAKLGRTHTHFSNTSVETVLGKLPYPENAVICKGVFPETTRDIDGQFIFVNLDFDLYDPTLAGLEFFWPKLKNGGIILIHDYFANDFFDTHKAVDEFCYANNLHPLPIGDVLSVAIIKQNA